MSTPEQRRRNIVEYVVHHGETSVEDLAAELDVSSMTVYRDVAQLERQGLVLRRKGEVRAADSSLSESAASIRKSKNQNVKLDLAAVAQTFIHPGMSICLDDSTTNLSVLAGVQDFLPCTIITNAQFIANEVRSVKDLSLILVGGLYESWADAYTGLVTETALSSLRADLCIMSATSVSTDACFHPSQEFARVKQRMLSISQRKLLLVDSSKFARSALYRVGPISDFDLVIVDSSMPAEFCEAVVDAGCELIVAPHLPEGTQ